MGVLLCPWWKLICINFTISISPQTFLGFPAPVGPSRPRTWISRPMQTWNDRLFDNAKIQWLAPLFHNGKIRMKHWNLIMIIPSRRAKFPMFCSFKFNFWEVISTLFPTRNSCQKNYLCKYIYALALSLQENQRRRRRWWWFQDLNFCKFWDSYVN